MMAVSRACTAASPLAAAQAAVLAQPGRRGLGAARHGHARMSGVRKLTGASADYLRPAFRKYPNALGKQAAMHTSGHVIVDAPAARYRRQSPSTQAQS